jgi:hypothetical protein
MHPPHDGGALIENLAADECATTPSHVRAVRGDHVQRASRMRGWTGPRGRGPADLSAGRAWHAAEPGTVATGRISARHCAAILNHFLIVLNSKIHRNL